MPRTSGRACAVAVVSQQCAHDDCKKRASYNYPDSGSTPKFCKQHAPTGMEDVVNKKCEQDGCNKIASYGSPDAWQGSVLP